MDLLSTVDTHPHPDHPGHPDSGFTELQFPGFRFLRYFSPSPDSSQVVRVHEEGRESEEEEDDAPGEGHRSHRDTSGNHSAAEDGKT